MLVALLSKTSSKVKECCSVNGVRSTLVLQKHDQCVLFSCFPIVAYFGALTWIVRIPATGATSCSPAAVSFLLNGRFRTQTRIRWWRSLFDGEAAAAATTREFALCLTYSSNDNKGPDWDASPLNRRFGGVTGIPYASNRRAGCFCNCGASSIFTSTPSSSKCFGSFGGVFWVDGLTGLVLTVGRIGDLLVGGRGRKDNRRDDTFAVRTVDFGDVLRGSVWGAKVMRLAFLSWVVFSILLKAGRLRDCGEVADTGRFGGCGCDFALSCCFISSARAMNLCLSSIERMPIFVQSCMESCIAISEVPT